MRRKVKGKPGQSVFDLALEAYGDATGVGLLLTDNTEQISSTQTLDQVYRVRDTYVNKKVATVIFGKLKPTSE